MTDDQIRTMVNRFLCWPIPKDFNPDGGINLNRGYIASLPKGFPGPSGTNLLSAAQAEAMIRHSLGE